MKLSQNKYVKDARDRKISVERNVRSSSAMEGISRTVFTLAAREYDERQRNRLPTKEIR